MRRFTIKSTLAAAALALSAAVASAAPMSTSDLLRPESAASNVWAKCYRVCSYYGWCGYGYGRHRCCKAWHRKCH